MIGSSREIWCSNRETGRFHEKLGDSRENWESWQVWYGVWWKSRMTGGGGWGEQGGKSPFSPLSEPISPFFLLFWANFSLLPKRLRFFFSLLPTFSPYFSLLPTFFGPFLPPPYSVPPPSGGVTTYCNCNGLHVCTALRPGEVRRRKPASMYTVYSVHSLAEGVMAGA